jgi:predicted Fe-Mo cluster-binding NifX family protein
VILMKKIAVPTNGKNVAQHFGRCPQYTIIDTENGEIIEKKVIDNPGHQPGFLPKYLKKLGVDCVLAGGMGRKAKDLFDKNGIEAITGVTGPVEAGVNLYLEKNLNTTEDICDHDHDHSGNHACH